MYTGRGLRGFWPDEECRVNHMNLFLVPGRYGCFGLLMLHLASRATAAQPAIIDPLMFNTPQADALLRELEVFPPDNPWNQVITNWPVHPDSQRIVASVGMDKPLRYNPDMSFILVPPNQPRVEVKLTGYPD